MKGPIARMLDAEHRHLGHLLEEALRGDAASYVSFRGALLRHIGIEEKILLPALRERGQEPPSARQLRLNHSALVAMLVPSPTPEILSDIRDLLVLHDPLEEGPRGIYALSDAAIPNVEAILARMAQAPTPPLAVHHDGPRAFAAIEMLVARARRAREE